MKIVDELCEVGFAEPQARAIAGLQTQKESGQATDIARLEGRVNVVDAKINILLGISLVLLVPMFLKTFFGG